MFNYGKNRQGGVTVMEYTGKDATAVIPAKINGLPVTEIGEAAFWECTGLTGVTIPPSVTAIGRSAFGGCTGLTGIEIPASVTAIGNCAFWRCTNLTGIEVERGNTAFTGVGGVLFTKDKTVLIACPAGKKGVYIIPPSVTEIRLYAFEDCTGLTGVEIPSSVTKIGNSAFSGCTGLTGITIPPSVTEIGEQAFLGCTGLAGVTISASVTAIGSQMFRGCTDLAGITVDRNNNYYAGIGGVLFNKDKTILITCPEGKQGAYTIPPSVIEIRNGAFFGCTGITRVEISPSVKRIGKRAFYGCDSLRRVTLSRRIQVGDEAFPADARLAYNG
jgi:hypothetical protein